PVPTLLPYTTHFRSNASVFLNKYTDLQLSTQGVVDGTPAILVGNAGKAKLKGGELEVTAAPAEGLLLNFGLAYLDQKFTELDERSEEHTSELQSREN